MSIEMSPHKLVNLRLGCRMQVLELVHGLELDDIQPIRQYPVGFPLQQMLTLISSDMRYSREHVCTMCCRSFNTVSMVDAAFTGFVVDVEVLEVVVKVNGAGAEISPEKGCVGREDCC